MMSSNLKQNASANFNTGRSFNDELMDVLCNDDFITQTADYLKEDRLTTARSIRILTSLLIKNISDKCRADKTNLSVLISNIKKIDEINFIYSDFISSTKQFDRLADHGLAFLLAIFSKDLSSLVKRLSSKSELKEESDFTLMTIISAKLLNFISKELGEATNDAFEVLSLLSPPIRGINKQKNPDAPSVETGKERDAQAEKDEASYLGFISWLVPIVLLIFFSYDFLAESYRSGSFSAVKFYEHTNRIAEDVGETTTDSFLAVKTSLWDRIVTALKKNSNKELGSQIDKTNISTEESANPGVEVKFGYDNPEDERAALNVANQIKLNRIKENFEERSLQRKLAEAVYSPSLKKAKFVLNGVDFFVNRIEMDEKGKEVIKSISQIINSPSVKGIDIIGHTDNIGIPAANQRISLERASATRLELIKNGLDPSKITARGVGGQEPLGDDSTPEGRKLNRRVEIVISK